MTEVSGASTSLFDLSAFTEEGKVIPDDVRQELDNYQEWSAQENGLVPAAVMPDLLEVSRQRWTQLKGVYNFKEFVVFGKKWYSRRQMEDFYKTRRVAGEQGRGRVSVKEAWNAAHTD